MAVYIKDLCVRYAQNDLRVLQKIDIDIGVKHLLTTQQVSHVQVRAAWAYSAGYTVSEIEAALPDMNVIESLIAFFGLLAETIDCTDEYLVQRAVRQYPKFAKTLDAYRRKIEAYGRTFD